MFLWPVLNHKNFENHDMYDCAKKLAKTEAVKKFVRLLLNICLRKCAAASEYMFKERAAASEYMFKERAAASESKCATASEYKYAAAS